LAPQIKADKDYILVKQIILVADILVKVQERELLPQNLSAIAADILFLVGAMGNDVTAAKISKMLLREQTSIRALLKRMETHGLINSTKNMGGKSLIRIALTAKGKNILKQAMKQKGTTHVLSRLTEEQRSKLKRTLTDLKEAGMEELYLNPNIILWP
jgi:DNA-binding MarR family transcriptional regulator